MTALITFRVDFGKQNQPPTAEIKLSMTATVQQLYEAIRLHLNDKRAAITVRTRPAGYLLDLSTFGKQTLLTARVLETDSFGVVITRPGGTM